MKGKYEKSERRGLPGGPNEMFTYTTGIFSTQGYKRDSPDVDNPFNIIPSGDITMKGVDFPVLGTDNLGNSKMMTPGNDYKFPGDMVFELPMAKDGLALDPPSKEKEMVNLHDFLITEEDLEFLNSERCFGGNCLENTRKAFDATAGSISGVPYTANVWGKDDLDITSIKNTPTKQQVQDFPWMDGDRGVGAADSWDIQGNIVRAEGKTLYNRNKEGAKIESDDKEIDDPTGKFQPGQYPIGSIYSFGPKGRTDTPYGQRAKGFNIDYGLQPSHHSVMSVGVNEKGEIILYDAYLKKYDTEENIIKQIANSPLGYELETVGVPKSYASLTPQNIKLSDNFYRPRYFTEYQFDVDRLDEIRQDPKFRIKEDDKFRAPRLDKEAMQEFSQSLKDNKETMMEALRLTSDEYDDLANLSIALAMGESEGGGGLSVDWAGSTQGLTQLNFDNIKDDEVLSRQLAMFNESVRGPQKIKQLADLRDPAKSAIATLIYTNAGRRRSSKLYEEGLEPGVRNFYDNTGLKDLVRSSSSRINRSGVYLDELNDRVSFSDIPGWNEKNVKKITTSLNALTGTNRYQADIDDDGDVYIKMKTLGNDPNMSDAMKIGYWWQSPSSLKTGDAQGGNVHAKRIEGYYKAISEKTPEVSTDKLMASNTEIPEMQKAGELKAQDLVPRDPFSTLSPAQREAFNASTVAALKAEEERQLKEYMRRSPGGDLFPDQGLKPITYNEEVAGWFPVAGEYIDAKNTGEALMRGDYVDAGFNAAGFLLPFIPGSFLKKLATSPYTPKFSKPSLLKQYRSKFPAADIRGAGTGDYSNLGIDELGLRGDDFTSLTNYERSAISQVNQAQAADDVFNTFVQRYADFNTDDALANQLADFSRKNPRTKFEMNLGKDATPSKRMQEIFDDPELNIHNVFSLESPGPTTVKNTYTGYYDKRFYDGSAHDPSGEWDKNLRSYGQQGFYATNVPTGKPVRQSLTHTNRRGELFDYKIETVPVADYMVNKGLMNPDNIVNLGRHRGLDPANQHNHLLFDTDKPSVIVSGNRGFAGLSGGNTSRMQMGRVGIPKPNRNVPSYNTEILPLLKQEFNLSRPFEGTFMKLPRSRTTYYNSKGEASKYINDRQLDSDIFFTRKNGGPLPKAQEGQEVYKVKSGDTFLGIANRLEIPREDFIEANPDINIDKLSLGQKLNIPVKKPYVPTNDVIPSEMLWRQAFAESNWETDVENKGGYKGLGQIGDDVITDYKKAFKVKEVDPFDPVQNSTIHKWYMNKLYNSEWINKPNQDPNVRLAKALAAYNWGPKTARKWFTDQRKAGVDIYNSFDWLEDLPSEPKGYIDMIIFNKNTPTRKYVEDLAKAMTDTTLTNQITNLYKRAGGEMNKLEMYKGYINGEFDGTDLEPKAQKVYDRMNRVYYAPAKKAGMSPPNFIMTNIIPRQLQTVL